MPLVERVDPDLAARGQILKINKRILFVLAGLLFLMLALVFRLAYIQIVKGAELRRLASMQQNQSRNIVPRRGSILDRNGNELAVSASVSTISINPREITLRYSKERTAEICSELCALLELGPSEAENILTKFGSDSHYELIRSKVETSVGDVVRKWIVSENLYGINVDEDSKRYYPNGNLAAQIIGFTRTDNAGNDGIEAIMEQYLKGVPGRMLKEVDAAGLELPFFGDEYYIRPQNGLNVVLTIDESIQYYASKALDKAIVDFEVLNGACVIVMDPDNGDILAMVSKPDYDLNTPWAAPPGADTTKWTGTKAEEVSILQASVWRNKAISDLYEPGSVFKAIVSAAALEENVVTPETRVNDYPVLLSGFLLECWSKPNLHGEESFREAVYNSCNPVFVKVAQQLGIYTFYKYIRAFGFYDMTGISLYGESKGYFHEKPTEIDMAVASFGQRFLVTPLEIITAYAAIANGGKIVKPRLVKELTDAAGNVVKNFTTEVIRTVISEKTSETLRDILKGVVTYGTGHNAYTAGYRVAGKTGTSETTEDGRYIASFSAIAPADDPAICVLVILDNPGGSQYMGGVTAASVAGRLVEDVLDYLGVEKVYTEEEAANVKLPVAVPDLTGMGVAEARELLANLGLKYRIVENSAVSAASAGSAGSAALTGPTRPEVFEQSPRNGATVVKGSVVIIYTYKPVAEVLATVPDLTGMSVSAASDALLAAGLNIKAEGNGQAFRQSAQAKSKVPLGQVIDVEFLVPDIDADKPG